MRVWGEGVRPGTSLGDSILEPVSEWGRQGAGLVLMLGKGCELQFQICSRAEPSLLSLLDLTP